jgi:haloalkane dehalogenase
VVAIVEDFGPWVAGPGVPKLLINGDPGLIQSGRVLDAVRGWANQTEITVPGLHFIQEDSAAEIGMAIASFVRTIRADA